MFTDIHTYACTVHTYDATKNQIFFSIYCNMMMRRLPSRRTTSLFMLSFLFEIRKTSLKFSLKKSFDLMLVSYAFCSCFCILMFLIIIISFIHMICKWEWMKVESEYDNDKSVMCHSWYDMYTHKPQGMMADGRLQRGEKIISLCQSRMRGNGSFSYY